MDGSTYTIQIAGQPAQPLQDCALANGSGTVSGGAVTSVSITCTTRTFGVGGTVTGLHGQGLVLRNNGGDDIAITQDGTFTFPTRIASTTPVDVQVAVAPIYPKQTCFVTNGTTPGVGADYSLVQVRCTATLQLGTARDDEALSVSSRAPFVYVAGRTQGDFATANAGGWDAFLIKLDVDGNLIWKRQFGTSGDDSANVVRVASDAIYVAGSTTGSLDGAAHGDNDLFVTKFDTDGNQIWTRQLGTSASDVAEALVIGNDGSIYICGYTGGDLAGTGSAGGLDLFVAKLDASGSVLWLRQFGSAADDAAYGMDIDASGTTYVVGSTQGDLDGNPNTSGGEVGFIAKYDSSGTKLSTQLMCQLGCFVTNPTTRYQTRFNAIDVGLSGEFSITGWMRNDSSGTFGQKGFLFARFESGVITQLGGGFPVDEESVGTQIVKGPADGGLYITGYEHVGGAIDKYRGFVQRVSAASFADMQYWTTFGYGYSGNSQTENWALGVTTTPVGSTPAPSTYVVGRTSGGLDGNANLGGTDLFIVHLNEVGEEQ